MPNTPDVSQPRVFKPPQHGQSINADGKYYFIGNFVGNGYFGRVYECTDEWGNPLVAKVLVPRDQTYDQVRDSWLLELKKLRELRHPNVTFVHAAFEFEDTFYLVIERCTMTLDVVITLDDLRPDGWIPHVARDILQALEFIHNEGYVHKDIHPGNVFVSQSVDRMVPTKEPVWSFKVGDLGISRLETEMSAFNTLLAQWMLPPEAIDPAQFGPVGRTIDVYHTALLLLAILLNRVPSFTKDEVLEGAPRKLAEASGSKYGPAIARALRRHVASRTPTAMHFWRDIDSASRNAL
jgi:serine/threonine protein kinase